MLTSVALGKLKAILIIDLIIVVFAASGFLYLQSTGQIEFGPRKAEFELTNFIISPSSVEVGMPVAISVNVTNVGDLDGNYSLSLIINGTIKEEKLILLPGGAFLVVDFVDTEVVEGNYFVEMGSLNGTFMVTLPPIPPQPSNIELSRLIVRPYEIWVGETVEISVVARNTGAAGDLIVSLFVDDQFVEMKNMELGSGESTTVVFFVTAITEGVKSVRVNNLIGGFKVVPTGMHTLTIVSSPIAGIAFTLNGEEYTTSYMALHLVGESYSLVFPGQFEYQNNIFLFSQWEDGTWPTGTGDAYRTFRMNGRTSISATYSGTRSCPSLYVWNGSDYKYRTEISAGTGYLGIFDYFREDGSLAFLYSYPWDFIKLDNTQIQQRNGYYDLIMTQLWDEVFYVDSAQLLIVDHFKGVDVFSTMGTYLYNLENQGSIYTVSKNPAVPVSAKNGAGDDVLEQISTLDGIYTQGTEFSFDTLELNLGDLSSADNIKLVVAGVTVYSSGQIQGDWASSFWNKPGQQPFPPPYMEVKDENGNWISVPESRQFPLVDVTAESFVVDLTGLFPTDDYSLRINSFFNSQFDYIGVDTTTQDDIEIKYLLPSYAELEQVFTTDSNSSGYFTRYGPVTELLKNPDDEYAIGRQGDRINVQFNTDDLPEVEENMERDYFLIVSCWFKVDGLPYLEFKVDPLPFHSMSAFLYPDSETYPYDIHLDYMNSYNTRRITLP